MSTLHFLDSAFSQLRNVISHLESHDGGSGGMRDSYIRQYTVASMQLRDALLKTDRAILMPVEGDVESSSGVESAMESLLLESAIEWDEEFVSKIPSDLGFDYLPDPALSPIVRASSSSIVDVVEALVQKDVNNIQKDVNNLLHFHPLTSTPVRSPMEQAMCMLDADEDDEDGDEPIVEVLKRPHVPVLHEQRYIDVYAEDELPVLEMCDGDDVTLPCSDPAPYIEYAECPKEIPVQELFTPLEEFEAFLIFVVSPLEFYVLRAADFKYRCYLECLMVECEPSLLQYPIAPLGPGEDYPPDKPCLAFVNGKLNRAVIRFAGFDDVQVYLLDYGMCHLVPNDAIFEMPLAIARYCPPLAFFCTLEAADSRMLDTFAWKGFLDKISENFHVKLRGYGDVRRTHGNLVEIIDPQTGHPMKFGNSPASPNSSQVKAQSPKSPTKQGFPFIP